MSATIEERYEQLRLEMIHAEERASYTVDHETYPVGLCERVAVRATELALADWPHQRARIARERGAMPHGPVTYSVGRVVVKGRTEYKVHSGTLSRGESRGSEPNYVHKAVDALRPELQCEADAARAAFDALAYAIGIGAQPEEVSS